MGLLAIVLKGVGVVLGVLLFAGGLAYATDYGVGGTVEEKGQKSSTGTYFIDLGLDIGPSVTRELPRQAWECLRENNYVVYHVRSAHTLVYEKKDGALLYDSESSILPAACLQRQDDGGGGGAFPFLAAAG